MARRAAAFVALLALSASIGPISAGRMLSQTAPKLTLDNAVQKTTTQTPDLTQGFGIQFQNNYGYGSAIPAGLVPGTASYAQTQGRSRPFGVVSDPITATSAIDVSAVPYSGGGVAANGGVGTSYNWFGNTGYLGIQAAISAAFGKGTAASLGAAGTPSGKGAVALTGNPVSSTGSLASLSAAANIINNGKASTIEVIPFVKRPYTKQLPPVNATFPINVTTPPIVPIVPIANLG